MNENNDKSSQSQARRKHDVNRLSRRKAAQRKRERNRRVILFVCGLVVVAIIVALIIGLIPQKNAKLLGVWQYDQYTKYEFSDDGQGCLCVDDVHYDYKYKISGDTIKLDFVEDVVRDCEYSFTIEDNTLTLIGGEGTDGGTYSLKKIDS